MPMDWKTKQQNAEPALPTSDTLFWKRSMLGNKGSRLSWRVSVSSAPEVDMLVRHV